MRHEALLLGNVRRDVPDRDSMRHDVPLPGARITMRA